MNLLKLLNNWFNGPKPPDAEWVSMDHAPKDGSSFIAWDCLNNEITNAYWLNGDNEYFCGWFHVGDFTGGACLSHMLKINPPR